MEGAPPLSLKRGRHPKGSATLTPYWHILDQLTCPSRGPAEAAERPPNGVGLLAKSDLFSVLRGSYFFYEDFYRAVFSSFHSFLFLFITPFYRKPATFNYPGTDMIIHMDEHAQALTAAKRAAGYQAADMVEDGMVVGLGTGSTVYFMIERLSSRVTG